ncbi:hypothetical protein [Aeromicrobium sp. Leaf350]|uniref:hypothetical protein n=1 Tax=Aeromicrobium sp. Leaf350 TaxID=2876565 RepID=UPI001E31BDB7|nr:hypothetical protein [Aeromicrobium sp. Leaf350]
MADLPVSASELLMINAGLTTAGRAPLPTDTVALRDSGESFAAVTSAGSLVERTAEDEPATAARGVIPKKIKEVVAACLGVSVAATGFWAAIVEQLTSWKKAVKFVVRRLGVVGAVSCMGGIVWKYL